MKYIQQLKNKINRFICDRGELEIMDVDSIHNFSAHFYFFNQITLTHGYTTIAAIDRDDMSLAGTVTRYTQYINNLSDDEKIREILDAIR